jgi:hypothetical protein
MPIRDIADLDLSAFAADAAPRIPMRCNDPALLDFCQALSSRLLRDPGSRRFPDVMTFGYFCRKSNISKVLKQMPDRDSRLGWGVVLHIAPANIPVNFAFSFLMGFLSGNLNYVRVPSAPYPQVDLIVQAIDEVLANEEFGHLRDGVNFFTCERGHPALVEMVGGVDGLVVWGGDATVASFKSMEKPISTVELYFPDRVSSVVLAASEIISLDAGEMTRLCDGFFNDTFLVDQNACSSPGLVFWVGDNKTLDDAKQVFWARLGERLAERYELEPVRMMDKHLDVMTMVAALGRPTTPPKRDDIVWRFDDQQLSKCKLRFGNFLEFDLDDIGQISAHLRPNEQTITQFGFASRDIFNALAATGRVVDRIVPVGNALAMSMHWDGKQVLNFLSRQVEIS